MQSTYFKQNSRRINITNVFIVGSLSLSLGLGLYLASILSNTQNRNSLGNVLGASTVNQSTKRIYSDETFKFEYDSSTVPDTKLIRECVLNEEERTFNIITFRNQNLEIQINPCNVVYDIQSVEKEMKLTSRDNKIFQYTLLKTSEGYIAQAIYQGENEIYIISKPNTFDETVKLEREIISIIASLEIFNEMDYDS